MMLMDTQTVYNAKLLQLYATNSRSSVSPVHRAHPVHFAKKQGLLRLRIAYSMQLSATEAHR